MYSHVLGVSAFLVTFCIQAITFEPKLTVHSCNRNRLTFTLTDAENGGLVYIQGSGSGCRHVTFAGSSTYEFNFTSCNVIWGRSFRVVVQKRPLYQTGDDTIIPVTCIVDLSDISVQAGVDTSPGNDDPPQTVVVRPSAFMTLFSRGGDVSGKLIQLSDNITMNIELHNQFKDEFDIQAMTCSASTIPIITRGCPTDPELFPPFIKLSRGVLTATFKAFIPTEYTSSTVKIIFSCMLNVCLNTCAVPQCSSYSIGYGRRRREKPSYNMTYEQLHVDSSLIVSTGNDALIEDISADTICIHKAVFVVCLALMFGCLVLTVYFIMVAYLRRQKSDKLHRYYCTEDQERSLESVDFTRSDSYECVDFRPLDLPKVKFI